METKSQTVNNSDAPTTVIHNSDHRLEIFKYGMYDTELRIYKEHAQMSIYLGGILCLTGAYSTASYWVWYYNDNPHLPNYKVRSYLRQYALKRIKE